MMRQISLRMLTAKYHERIIFSLHSIRIREIYINNLSHARLVVLFLHKLIETHQIRYSRNKPHTETSNEPSPQSSSWPFLYLMALS